MPEGPEIRRAADAIEKVLKGHVIEDVDLNHASLTGKRRQIAGHTVLSVECRGKALLTHFSSGKSLYSHNQLYGKWRVVSRGRLPSTKRALRLALHTDKHSALLYSATDISLWETCRLDQHPFLSRLGPDLLAADTTKESILQRLQSPDFRNRQLASLYLDQRFVAGIGNYLRSEILFFAGVHPLTKPRDLNEKAQAKLARNTTAIGQRSYRTGGITLPPSIRPEKSAPGKRTYERDRFAVFARASKACRICRTPVQKSVITSRRIYWCPTCQPN